ncbi:MAG: PQQ-binding-like beta-propeller repeat protein [Acidobacteriota bacterium]|nr:PQQ-binding-like beta-propeller repeat protein [Acidobacteriota bacterium]
MSRRVPTMIVFCLMTVAATGGAIAAEGQLDWPSFRGPNLDGALQGVGGITDETGLELNWKHDYGSGYASLVATQGLVIGGFSSGDLDLLSAVDATTGEEVWRAQIGPIYNGHDGSHDGPIATPFVAGGRVYMLGAWGELFALELKSGKELWRTHLVENHEIPKPHYGFSTSPILVDGVLVVELGDPPPPPPDADAEEGEVEEEPTDTGGGKAVGGFDPETGALKWTLGTDQVAYQSPTVALIGGKRLVIAASNKKLFGINASAGTIAFEYEHQGDGRAIGSGSMNPVAAGEGRFLLSNTTDGSSMIQVKPDPELGYAVEELWNSNSIRGTYVTPVVHDGHLYGVTGRVLTCVSVETGESVWKSRQPGDGFITLLDDHLVIITKAGTLHLARATPDGYQEIAQIPLFEELSWSQVAFADGGLFARSMNEIARVDLSNAFDESMKTMTTAMPAGSTFASFLRQLESATEPSATIDEYLASQVSFPIIEGMDLVHFVYRGEANDVGVRGDIIGARREDPMTRVAGTDLFYYTARFEPNARVNYGFIKNFEENIVDPLNDRTEPDGQDGELSWFAMPAWRKPWYLDEAGADRQGKIVEHTLESKVVEGRTQVFSAYLPAGYDEMTGRLPVIYFHGGDEALDDGGMKNALDNLIGKTVAPVIGVFLHAGERTPGPPNREGMAALLATEIVPVVDETYRTIAEAAGRASFGAGGSGYAAYFTALEQPGIFGQVLTQSAILFGGQLDALKAKVRNADEQPLTIYQDWGTYDLRSPHEAWDMRDSNSDFRAFLRDRGYRPVGGEVPTGIGWAAWQNQTDDLLETLFPL